MLNRTWMTLKTLSIILGWMKSGVLLKIPISPQKDEKEVPPKTFWLNTLKNFFRYLQVLLLLLALEGP